jgi:hypothetical protein
MALTPTEIASEIRDNEGIIHGLTHEIARIDRMMNDDEYYNRTRARVADQLARLQKELYDIDEARNNGLEVIGRYHESIDKKRQQNLQLKHAHKIAKMKELMESINNLQDEIAEETEETEA